MKHINNYKQNRQKLPKSITVPKLPSNKSSSDNKYIKEAQEYVKKHFGKNYGTVEDFQFPISHQTALKWLDNFFKNKFSIIINIIGLFVLAIPISLSILFNFI